MRVVTIDGPGGAGKSTVARRLSERLGRTLLDTGAMYRAVTLAAIERGVDLGSEEALVALVERISVVVEPACVRLDGVDVSLAIRSVEITRNSRFAADSPGVRSRLVAWQREFAERVGDVITEGRDQGTIVFPDAYRKFFLTASDEERARRRHAELAKRNVETTFEEVLADLRERDARDEARAIAPLRPADDARIVDSTGLALDDVVAKLEADILQDSRKDSHAP
ncbi:MAG: (d)CMP kinase [Isosphaeraceae bacterium]|nr:(d)CMP kinase [Isosphaeraceae bacterium]